MDNIDYILDEKEKIKQELQKFKSFWYGIMNIFHKRVNYEENEQYKYVSEDLHKAGVFSDDEFEIATNIYRKVKPKEDIDKLKINNKNNMNLN